MHQQLIEFALAADEDETLVNKFHQPQSAAAWVAEADVRLSVWTDEFRAICRKTNRVTGAGIRTADHYRHEVMPR
jgi:hypothetical protein